MPALASPAARACSRNSPEMRVSRPMTTCAFVPSLRTAPKWRAAASPIFSARSAVISTFARPRTPSVPNNRAILVPSFTPASCRKALCQLFPSVPVAPASSVLLRHRLSLCENFHPRVFPVSQRTTRPGFRSSHRACSPPTPQKQRACSPPTPQKQRACSPLTPKKTALVHH